MRVTAALLALALSTAPAFAQTVSPAPTPSNGPEAAERKICKQNKVTGTRLMKIEVCKTEKQWAESEANTRRGINDQQVRGAQSEALRGAGG